MDEIVREDIVFAVQPMEMNAGAEVIDYPAMMDVIQGEMTLPAAVGSILETARS